MILSDLKQQISDIINNTGLSIDAVYFVVKDIFNEIEKLYYLQLQKENDDNNNNNDDEEPKN